MRETFKFFDADGSGSITVEELGEAMKSLGVTISKEKLETMLKEVDEDGTIISVSCRDSLALLAYPCD